MTILEAIQARHSVRSYTEQKIPAEAAARLTAEIGEGNRKGGLSMQLVTDEPRAFDGMLAHYGKFTGVRNYVALIGPAGAGLEERIGYYGQRVALLAQTLGLNTCWVAMTVSKGEVKRRCAVARGEKLVCVLALGYGATQGVPHRSKPMEALCQAEGPLPDWFRAGMEAAMLAPTASNQQKFRITLTGDCAEARSLSGFYSKVDLGIVRYHFEIGSGHDIR